MQQILIIPIEPLPLLRDGRPARERRISEAFNIASLSATCTAENIVPVFVAHQSEELVIAAKKASIYNWKFPIERPGAEIEQRHQFYEAFWVEKALRRLAKTYQPQKTYLTNHWIENTQLWVDALEKVWPNTVEFSRFAKVEFD